MVHKEKKLQQTHRQTDSLGHDVLETMSVLMFEWQEYNLLSVEPVDRQSNYRNVLCVWKSITERR